MIKIQMSATHADRIKKFFKAKIKLFAQKCGYDILEYKPDSAVGVFNSLKYCRDYLVAPDKGGEEAYLRFCLSKSVESSAHIFQDLFVLFLTKSKRGGYFIEFGATDGVTLSNTYLLENKYGWSGIVAEPAKCWQDDLKRNRKCSIDNRCVWSSTGSQLEFTETSNPLLSTASILSNCDMHSLSRIDGKKYIVETVSLNDLLEFHGAPHDIDYLSIDTEGSELLILSKFNFSLYNINIITVEHNYILPERDNIRALLNANGYTHVFEKFSMCDDWYVKNEG
jgi:FkbM family methyltransferase